MNIFSNRKIKVVLIPIAVLALALFVFYLNFEPTPEPEWGINFSILHAAYLHEDWREMFIDILNELKPKNIRTMAYWSIIEPERGNFDFSRIDFLLRESQSRAAEVILVLGPKQPRWPECHEPGWYRELSAEEKEEAVRDMIEVAVNHFKVFDNITAWQVENEPFFPFSEECPVIPARLIRQEVELVKKLDNRPVVLTDSGEWGLWLPSGWAGADIFGSTMYRTVYHGKTERYATLKIPAFFYQIRAGALQMLTGAREVAGIELQAEPWFAKDLYLVPLPAQLELMNPEIFAEHVAYAKRVGFKKNYFWGTEWWYYLKEQGRPEMWITAKKFLR